jgi:hypothetical protein
MNVLRRSARKSRLERIQIEHKKEIMGVKGKPDIIDIIQKKRIEWEGHVKRMPEEGIPKLIMEWVPEERQKKRTSKENMYGGSTSSHDSEKFRTISMEKRRGRAFGLWERATVVIELDR